MVMDKKTFDRGREIRSSVLGKEFVDNAFATADDFNRPLQELVTEYCWGKVWGREGLSRATRSLLNVAMLSCVRTISSDSRGCFLARRSRFQWWSLSILWVGVR